MKTILIMINKQLSINKQRWYRLGLRRHQALPPQADALQRTKVRRAPVEPLVVSTAPLAVVDQNPLLVIIDLLNSGSIPAETTAQVIQRHSEQQNDQLNCPIIYLTFCIVNLTTNNPGNIMYKKI